MLPRAASASFPTGYSERGGETGQENKTQNNSFQTIAFYSMYRAQQAEHPLTAALGAGCNTDTHTAETDGPHVPQLGSGRGGGTAGVAQPLRGRGRVSAWGEPLWGWGQRTRKPLSSELGSSQEWGPSSSRTWCPQPWHEAGAGTSMAPTCLWQNLTKCACFLLHRACGLGKPP